MNQVVYVWTDDHRDLTDMLIACQGEEQKEGGNAILKQMKELHYIHILTDVIFGEHMLKIIAQ